MARAALGWTAKDLAAAAGLSKNTVHTVEADEDTRPSTLTAIEAALVKAGVEFIDGDVPGVRVHPKRKAKRGKQ